MRTLNYRQRVPGVRVLLVAGLPAVPLPVDGRVVHERLHHAHDRVAVRPQHLRFGMIRESIRDHLRGSHSADRHLHVDIMCCMRIISRCVTDCIGFGYGYPGLRA